MNVKIFSMGTQGLYTLLKPNLETATFDIVDGGEVHASKMTLYGFGGIIKGHCNAVTAPSVEYKDCSKWKQGAFINFVNKVNQVAEKHKVGHVLVQIICDQSVGTFWQCDGKFQILVPIDSAMI